MIDERTLDVTGINLTELAVTFTWAQTPTTSKAGLRLQVYHVTRNGESMHGEELVVKHGTSPLSVLLDNLSIPLNETSFLMIVAGYAIQEIAPGQGAIVSSETPYTATVEGKGVRIAASEATDGPALAKEGHAVRAAALRRSAAPPVTEPIFI